jgi:hypothetical protein
VRDIFVPDAAVLPRPGIAHKPARQSQFPPSPAPATSRVAEWPKTTLQSLHDRADRMRLPTDRQSCALRRPSVWKASFIPFSRTFLSAAVWVAA